MYTMLTSSGTSINNNIMLSKIKSFVN
uniref:Uncharacterized protein n=1 Tax=Arundo donax TaxID=35708 RepID=A0A0A9CDB5_ARUDO